MLPQSMTSEHSKSNSLHAFLMFMRINHTILKLFTAFGLDDDPLFSCTVDVPVVSPLELNPVPKRRGSPSCRSEFFHAFPASLFALRRCSIAA